MARLSLFAVVALALAQIAYFWGKLPEQVAMHYDFAGQPNNYGSKLSLLVLYGGAILMMALIFGLMTQLMRKMPSTRMNLPNRDYWLAPERIDRTWAKIESWSAVQGIGTVLFMAVIFGKMFQANTVSAQQPLDTPLLPIAAFVVFTMGWTIALIASFARIPK